MRSLTARVKKCPCMRTCAFCPVLGGLVAATSFMAGLAVADEDDCEPDGIGISR